MLQTLPIYAATGNMVLCYNLVHLVDVRAVGPGRVPARARSDRTAGRRVSRGAGVRVHAIPLSQSSHLRCSRALDAVRAVRLPTLLRDGRHAAARRRGRVAGAPEPVVRLLPAVLLAVRGGVLPVRNGGARPLAKLARVAVAARRRGGRRDRHVSLRVAVPQAPPHHGHRRALVRGVGDVFGRHLRLWHHLGFLATLGRTAARVSEGRERRASSASRSSRLPASDSRAGLRRAAVKPACRAISGGKGRSWPSSASRWRSTWGSMLTMFVTGSLPFLVRSRPWRDTESVAR